MMGIALPAPPPAAFAELAERSAHRHLSLLADNAVRPSHVAHRICQLELHAGAGQSPAEVMLAPPRVQRQLGELTISRPYGTYMAGLEALREQPLTEVAYWRHWSYILFEDDEPVAAVEIGADEQGKPEFRGTDFGPLAEGFVRAVETMSSNRQWHSAGDYQLRFLQVPSIAFNAVWLHCDKRSDLLLPILPAYHGLEPNQVYRAEQVEQMLRKRADDREQPG